MATILPYNFDSSDSSFELSVVLSIENRRGMAFGAVVGVVGSDLFGNNGKVLIH